MRLVLENNFFSFEDQVYFHTSGTAMGTKMAPTYAILVMGYLETKLYVKVKELFNNDVANIIQERWTRYIDDCFLIWNKDFR